MVHSIDNHFVISSGGAWVPGVYETKEAAYYAFQFENKTLQQLQDKTNGGVITTQVLKDCMNGDLKA